MLNPSKQHRTYINRDQKVEAYNQIPMRDRMENSKHRKRYSRISTEKRIKLIDLVLDKRFTITKAAKVLHIKRPTAKMIISRFQKAGTYFEKKMPAQSQKRPLDQGKRQEIEEEQVIVKQAVNPRLSINIDSNDQTIPSCSSPPTSQGQITYLLYYLPYVDYCSFL